MTGRDPKRTLRVLPSTIVVGTCADLPRAREQTQEVFRMAETNLFTDGEAYELTMGRWSLLGDKFIDWLDAPKGLRWLDVGCGNGAFTERLISCAAPKEIVAIDPSEQQLAYAKVRPGAKFAKFQ